MPPRADSPVPPRADSPVTGPSRPKGVRLGLSETGPGSLAPTGRRIVAFVVDALASALVAGLFLRSGATHLPQLWSLVPFAADYVLGVLLAGRTVGMRLLGLRLIRVDRPVAIGPVRVAVRTALLILLIPALVVDRDGRGLHDRLTDTTVIRD